MFKFRNPDSARGDETLRARGDAARDRYSWREAVDFYRRHLEIDPADEAIWVQLGNCEKEAGRIDEAERCYLRALSLEPTNADTYVQLGHIEKLKGRLDQALAWYRKALAHEPTLRSALHEVAEIGAISSSHTASGNTADAESGLTEGIESRFAEITDQLGAIKAVAVELQRLRRHVEGLDCQIKNLQGSIASLEEAQATMQEDHLGRLAALEAAAPALQQPFPALLAQLSELNVHRTEIDACRGKIEAVERQLRAAAR